MLLREIRLSQIEYHMLFLNKKIQHCNDFI